MPHSLNSIVRFAGWILAVILLIVLISIGWQNGWFERSNVAEEPEARFTPNGMILLTYAATDKLTDTAALLPAFLNFATGEARYINADQNMTPLTGIHHAVSPNNKWLVFLDAYARDAESTDAVRGWPDAIYRVQLSEGSIADDVRIAAAAAPTLETTYSAFPDIADNGAVLYMAAPAAGYMGMGMFFANSSGEEWDIVLLDTSGETRTVTSGSHPQWIDEQNFLFLKNNGIYHYSLSSGTETLLIPSLTPVVSAHRLTVDSANRRVAFIEPATAAVRIFDLQREGMSLALEEREPIMAAVTSAAFSPDGNYLAMNMLPKNYERSHIPFAVYNLKGEVVYESILPNASVAYTSVRLWVPN